MSECIRLNNLLKGKKLLVKKEIEKSLVNDNESYAIKDSFTPKSYSDQTAVDICRNLNDLQNFAYYRSIVFRIGPDKSILIWEKAKTIIETAKKNKDPIDKPGAIFATLVKKYLKGDQV